MFIHINCEEIEIYAGTIGVGSVCELFPTKCMVSPNDVEETKVWTDYNNISSKH